MMQRNQTLAKKSGELLIGGPERFAVLHIIVQVFLHVSRPRGSEQAAVSKRSRAEFSRALKPGDDFARIQKFERCFDLSIFRLCETVGNLAIIQNPLDFLI